MPNENIRVGCYVRVSTENQLENYSIEEQTERLKAYCKSMGWNNYYFYSDPGYSGGTTDRPALTQLLKDISAGKINMVAVYKLDRLSRSQKDTLVLIEDEFLAKGVEFTSVLERFDTSTPFGRATLGMLSVFAQLEKDQITERFTMGRIGRGKAGYFHGGPTAPKGYKYIKGEVKGDGRLVVDEFKAAQVGEIFDRFLSGHSINSIFEYMNGKYGDWSHTNIYGVLRNNTYTGKVKFKGKEYQGIHEPIISEEIFQRAQELLRSKEMPKKTPFRAETLLSSLVYCKRCKARYHGDHGYYKCYSRSKSDKKYIIDPSCRNDNWRIEELDRLVIDEIKKLKYSPGYLDGIFAERPSERVPDKASISKRLGEVERQIVKLLDLYQITNVPYDQITPRISALQDERGKLIGAVNNISDGNALSKMDFIIKLNSMEQVFASEGVEEKRIFISYMVKFIEINGEEVKIHWRI